ncbi:formin-like protein 2 [Athalia rosae]|uniref:formin-like protein 2 n=1 Tax=Athalia rosae TaxID=37344 RepID=UPI0006251004|nr:formin-like protein 2 [Athalia rosae]
MFYRRQDYFYRLTKSFPLLRYIDLYDPQSFIRENVLDNLVVCMLVYCLFYIGIWYADRVIKRIVKINEQMCSAVADNKAKLEDLITLKKKRVEYEEVVIKTKGIQRQTEKYLVNELDKLGIALTTTEKKIGELEKVFKNCKSGSLVVPPANSAPDGGELFIEGGEMRTEEKPEDVKILEPSFPPPLPPEPPPRKYGTFAARPPGHRVTPRSPLPPPPAPPKIGFKLSSVG